LGGIFFRQAVVYSGGTAAADSVNKITGIPDPGHALLTMGCPKSWEARNEKSTAKARPIFLPESKFKAEKEGP